MTIAALVLAAGSSARLGQAKQLLPIAGTTLLDQTLRMVRRCGLDQIIVALGGSSGEVCKAVDLAGCDVVENPAFTTGCSSTIVRALEATDAAVHGLVLFLGDQPFVDPRAVGMLVSSVGTADMGVCRYDDGLGHPLWFDSSMFAELRMLHGDKAVWKLLSSAGFSTAEVPIDGPTPLDVDTWEDYEALIAQSDQAQSNQAQSDQARTEQAAKP